MPNAEAHPQLSGLPPALQGAGGAVLGRLEAASEPWRSRKQLETGKGAKAAVEALVQSGVLVSAGFKGKTEYLTLNRGPETLTMEAYRARQVSAERQRLIETLDTLKGRFVAKNKLLGAKPTPLARQAYAALETTGEIVDVGKWQSAASIARTQGRSPKDVLKSLAIEVILEQAMPNKLVALPVEVTKAPWKTALPVEVKSAFPSSLKQLLQSGQVVMLDGVGKGLFVLTGSLREALESARSRGGDPPRAAAVEGPVQSAVAVITNARENVSEVDAQRIRSAYRRLAADAGSPHVVIAELWEASGAPLDVLKSWLMEECRAQRAEPALGEPTLATGVQLEAALQIDGRPHLYIRLEEP